ncbi:A24 family peptidase [Patescibacteria group bacterium]|nr:A24 family peptidase [Patescibacteria group bacterium]MDE1946752.1 prepilin peptidase [Patescibacteria group bacterium]MDE2010945.1 prepilin peptidase [Patescibacteria group bacterium]MDE2233566.1 prepilin peptidase [Patescibacteria group bacterium]
MDTLSSIFSFLFGAIVGSFLNVVSLRYKTGRSVGGRSKCMACGKELAWLELIPILSFFMQGGSCRKCKSKISWQYPLVEFSAGALFVLIFFKFPPVSYEAALVTLLYVFAACLLVVITVHDIKHKIIPDPFVWSFDVLALVSLFVGGNSWWHIPSYENLIAGPLLAVPFALIWLVSRGRWMGLGDAKLVLGIGWFLGVNLGVNALILSFWIGAAVSVGWLFATYKKFKRNQEIPFGPYLILGMYLVLIFGIQVIDMGMVRQVMGV